MRKETFILSELNLQKELGMYRNIYNAIIKGTADIIEIHTPLGNFVSQNHILFPSQRLWDGDCILLTCKKIGASKKFYSFYLGKKDNFHVSIWDIMSEKVRPKNVKKVAKKHNLQIIEVQKTVFKDNPVKSYFLGVKD